MLELTMASTGTVETPSVLVQQFQYLSHFHFTLRYKPQALMAIPYTLFDASSMASANVGCA